jgi:hypothetical protein
MNGEQSWWEEYDAEASRRLDRAYPGRRKLTPEQADIIAQMDVLAFQGVGFYSPASVRRWHEHNRLARELIALMHPERPA